MIDFFLNAIIMVVAAIMAAALWRSRNDRLGKIGQAGDIALAGAISIVLAKVVGLAAILATMRPSVSSIAVHYLDLGGTAVAILGITLFAFSLLRWLDAGKQLSSTTDTAIEHSDRLRAGFIDRGLALSTVPAILYRGDGPIGDPNTRNEFLNDKVGEILGHSGEELESDPTIMIRLMHPDDRRRYYLGEDRLVMSQPRSELEHRFMHKNGKYRWIRRNITRVEDEHGNFKELIGCAFDITDLKDAEARLQNFLDSAPDAVVTVDATGHIIAASGRATCAFGYSKEELLSQHFSLLLPDEQRTLHQCLLAGVPEVDSNCEFRPSIELSGLRKDGTTFPVEVNISALMGGDCPLVALAIRDISARRDTEAKLQQAQKMESVGQLTGGIAHDFNNMLTVISGNLQMLETESLGEQPREFVAAAMQGVESAAGLTSRLLAFSRQQVLTPNVIEVNELVSGIECLLRHTLGRNLTLETALADNLWPVRVDPGQLENALVNLAINARDALEPGGRLNIETSNAVLDEQCVAETGDVSPGEYVRITIGDNGVGIPNDVLPHIFDPFYTTKDTGKGSGLGLSMVYGFVKQSRGHIEVSTEEGCGTSINLFLPKFVSEIFDVARSEIESAATPTGGERILVVEDNNAVREVVGNQLTSLNYQVMQADSGQTALELLEINDDIDLLFTDLEMPGGMTGVELAETIRQRNPSLRVLYSSGYSSDTLLENELLTADDAVLNKPYQKETLARSVRGVLDQE